MNEYGFLLLSICFVAGAASGTPERRGFHPGREKPLLDKTIAVDAQHDAECQDSSAFHFVASWAG